MPKGFEHTAPEGGGGIFFAHYSTIQMDGYRTLKAGRCSPVLMCHRGLGLNHASVIVPIEAGRCMAPLSHCVYIREAKCQPDRLAFLLTPVPDSNTVACIEPTNDVSKDYSLASGALPPGPVAPRFRR